MYLPIPTPLVFLFLGIASFAPTASYWPGWWMAYDGALLVCWVVASVAAMRRVAQEERRAKRKLVKKLRQHRDRLIETPEMDVDLRPNLRPTV
jgi:membrane protein implicated in regulation of membrane protease activity